MLIYGIKNEANGRDRAAKATKAGGYAVLLKCKVTGNYSVESTTRTPRIPDTAVLVAEYENGIAI